MARAAPRPGRPGRAVADPARPAGHTDKRRDQVIYYQFTADRARRTLHGIDEQSGKAERAVAGKDHRLLQIERSFRMSQHDLAARPIYHHKRASIEAHLTIVFAALAALAVSRLIEARSGWSVRRVVQTARRYRTVRSTPAPACSPPLIPSRTSFVMR